MNYRKDFPMLEKDIVYFDNGATTFKPNCVIDKMCDYYKNYFNSNDKNKDTLFHYAHWSTEVCRWFENNIDDIFLS